MMQSWKFVVAVAVAAALTATAAQAQKLVIGARAEVEMDPHYFWLGSNTAYYIHFYGALGVRDPSAQVQPSLAASWTPIDNTTWEYKLREGLNFDDGTPFTAEDVIASIERVPNVPNVVNSYVGNTRSIAEMVAIDPYTIHFKTKKPDPLLTGSLANIVILPKEIAETAATPDFAAGKTAVGLGPFKFKEFIPGDRLVLTRNEDYFGKKPDWEEVTFKFIANDSSRAAAMLGGDVDMIDFVAPADVAALQAKSNIKVHIGPSDRTIFLGFDVSREPTPYATDKDGNPLAKNPFKDVRVRRAFSMAMNRDAITSKVMENLAFPAGQVVPPGFGGYDKSIPIPAYDVAGAKKLMTAAGYPDGFGLTVHCTSDRYVNDGKICQTVGQMLARIGMKMQVEALPKAVYFPKALSKTGDAYTFFMLGWGSSSNGEADYLWQGAHTYNKEEGFGVYNLGNYSNPEVDKIIEQAVVTLDREERYALERKAMAIAIDDGWVVPLHYQSVVVATRKGIDYQTRADEGTSAMQATPAK